MIVRYVPKNNALVGLAALIPQVSLRNLYKGSVKFIE